MKISILSTSRSWAGAEVHAAALAEFLQSQGHDVTIACIGEKTFRVYQDKVGGNLPLVKLREENLNVPGGFSEWRKLISGLATDVVIFEKPTLHAGSFAFDCAVRLSCKRFIVIQQVRPPSIPANASKRWYSLGLFRHKMRLSGFLRSLAPHGTICVSESVRTALRTDYWFPLHSTWTVRNGADTDRFVPDADARTRLRREFHIEDDVCLIGSACRLSQEKGLEFGLECFARAIESVDRKVIWLMAGDGPLRDPIQEKIEQLGIADQVRMIGFVSDPAPFYAAIDVFFLPSRREGLPLSLIEALSAGCCPVTSDVDGIPEVLDGSGIGWMVSADDAEGFVEALHGAVSLDREARDRMAQQARSLAVERFRYPEALWED